MKSIEEKLWDYIDGTCTVEEQQTISLLIKNDKAYQHKYNELLQLNNEFARIELDEPSMPFTYNVMEAIRAEQAQKPLKVTINAFIIKSIAGIFAVLIIGAFVALFINMNWSANTETSNRLTLPDFDLLLNNEVLTIFLFLDTVLGLFFLDTYLRKRRFLKHQ